MGEESHTTILGFSCRDFALIAHDGYTTLEPFLNVVNTRKNKSLELTHHAYLGMSGSGRCSHDLQQNLRTKLEGQPEPADMDTFADDIGAFVNGACVPLWARRNVYGRFLLVGMVPQQNIFEIHLLQKETSVDPRRHTYVCSRKGRICCIGSGSGVDAVIDHVGDFNENMHEGQAVEYARRGIELAIGKDWSSGGQIKIVVIYPCAEGKLPQTRLYLPRDPKRSDSEYRLTLVSPPFP